nr:L-type lectin-domain containing receptor kinase IX.1-like [Tanacetum cinerariifolium]
RHRNLVQLIGWCHDQTQFLLVYEFLPNASLDYYLFSKKSPLEWDVRYKIAMGLASALLYLHEECEQCVVHRDIKASNIMLDSGYNSKLGDFGLARFMDHELGFRTTGLAGTLGYMSPEYVTTGKASKESDVYSFGVVALEIACGRKVTDGVDPNSDLGLVHWVWDLLGKDELLSGVDLMLNNVFDKKEVECLMRVGLWCAHPDSRFRPSISQAIQVLKFERTLPNLPVKMPVPTYFVASDALEVSSASASMTNNSIDGVR